jgi:hypothetical protein
MLPDEETVEKYKKAVKLGLDLVDAWFTAGALH